MVSAITAAFFCIIALHFFVKKRKLNGTLYLDEGLESSRDAGDNHVNGSSSNSESSSKRNRKQRDNSSNRHRFYSSSPESLGSKQSDFELWINDGIGDDSKFRNEELDKQNECIRYSQVQCKKDFSLIEMVDGRSVNVLQGLELHTQVFNPMEQRKIVECIYRLQWRGMQGKLKERTYSKPKKWMRGKGRVTIQFGCCYNYAKVLSPGEFSGPASIPLPVGSVFVIDGNGANVAKHCIPSVKSKRISITFRKMDQKKVPYTFSPDTKLEGIKPLSISSPKKRL